MIRAEEQVWLDQQDAQLRAAVHLVLEGMHDIDATDVKGVQELAAMNVGAALAERLNTLTETEIRYLANQAIIRLAQAIATGGTA